MSNGPGSAGSEPNVWLLAMELLFGMLLIPSAFSKISLLFGKS